MPFGLSLNTVRAELVEAFLLYTVKPFFVYLLKCSDGSYYGGQTDDMAVRMHQHHAGEIGYTSTRKPVELVWQGEFETRAEAVAFEQQIKGWSRAKKEALIAGDWDLMQELAKSKAKPVRPELVEGLGSETRLRQAQPEQVGETAEATLKAKPVRPELVEGLGSETRLRQAQSERVGEIADATLKAKPVRPELVEGLGSETRLRQAQPERLGVAGEGNFIGRIVRGEAAVQRRAIAKAITLLESTRADHRAQGDELLTALLPHTGKAMRLGISGVPGVGKSTFIEVLGLYLIAQGHRVAVLTIDPSSSVSGGSILGDKTRMEKLSVHERAYIRPSPSSGNLGGVAEKTREAMLVCEAAGYDVVIVETVGVGQSETAVANMTDMFVLMQLPNAGDDLQAIKKGVMELADLVIINKADIDADAAMRAEAQITSAMRLFGLVNNAMGSAQAASYDKHWHPQVIQLSALHNKGVDAFWKAVTQFKTLQTANGQLDARRKQQSLSWMWERIDAGLKQAFRRDPAVSALLPTLVVQVADGRMPASTAARSLLAAQSGRPPAAP